MIVAIDGPSGVGKSTAAKRLAQELGLPYLDTGSMYRAVAYALLQQRIDPSQQEQVEAFAADLDLELQLQDSSFELRVEGRPVGDEIRRPEVGTVTSRISVYAGVRSRMVALQRSFGERHGGVVEGRDIGSVVFPETQYKFYLDADPETRVERRRKQLALAGRVLAPEAVREELADRDRRDRQRLHGPLTVDDTYHVVDTSALALDEVVQELVAAIARIQRERNDS